MILARHCGDRRRAAARHHRGAQGDAAGDREGAHRRGRGRHGLQQRALRRDRPIRDAGGTSTWTCSSGRPLS